MADIYDMMDTWNDAGVTFSAIKMDVTDTASAAGSNLLDLRLGGAKHFEVTNDRQVSLYNTYTDASNYERGFMRWDSNVLEIGAEAAGTGVIRRKLAMPALNEVAFDSGVAIYGGSGAGSPLDIGGVGSLSTIPMRVSYSDITIAQRADIGFTSGTSINTIKDAGLKRAAAGKIQITDGSTGTGELIFIVPTTDPGITGALWNNAGTLSISA